jgi:hypothetical protein
MSDNSIAESESESELNIKTEMTDIDKLTLELMMNKSQYSKYLSKYNTAKYRENEEYHDKIGRYKKQIYDIIHEKMDQPDTSINHEIDTIFHDFLKACIKHFELQLISSQANSGNYHNEQEDDMMFENCTDMSTHQSSGSGSSFWSGDRVSKINNTNESRHSTNTLSSFGFHSK